MLVGRRKFSSRKARDKSQRHTFAPLFALGGEQSLVVLLLQIKLHFEQANLGAIGKGLLVKEIIF